MWCVGSGCVLILIKCVEQEQKIFKRSCETLWSLLNYGDQKSLSDPTAGLLRERFTMWVVCHFSKKGQHLYPDRDSLVVGGRSQPWFSVEHRYSQGLYRAKGLYTFLYKWRTNTAFNCLSELCTITYHSELDYTWNVAKNLAPVWNSVTWHPLEVKPQSFLITSFAALTKSRGKSGIN